MELSIKSISDLLDYNFNIPKYQRGYRWERKQVTDLLNDLKEYNSSKNSSQFYCLQPVVVKLNDQKSIGGKKVYDIIDGQQRLTTIYLILSYLKETRLANYSGDLANKLFTLELERDPKGTFLKKEGFRDDSESSFKFIDYFYMRKAFKNISEWFEKNSMKGKILERLINDEQEKDTRVIWYDLTPDENHINSEKSVDVFTRLNEGKIPLTNSELIKALLFQTDKYGKEERPLMKERIDRMATEWDEMEKKLQNPFIWSMLTDKDYKPSSHISLILSLVSREIYYEDKGKDKEHQLFKELTEDGDDFDFLIIEKFLNDDSKGKAGEKENKLKRLWIKIEDTFTVINNWFNDREIYHLTGLYIYLKGLWKNEKSKSKVFDIIHELMTNYKNSPKDKYKDTLQGKIGSLIRIDQNMNLNEIVYGYQSRQIVRILTAFNVEMEIEHGQENSYFPFQLMKDFNVISLEHIHPQHIDIDGKARFDDLMNWMSNKVRALLKTNSDRELIDLGEKFLNIDEKEYNEKKTEYDDIIKKVDQKFDELAEMAPEHMHTLYNRP